MRQNDRVTAVRLRGWKPRWLRPENRARIRASIRTWQEDIDASESDLAEYREDLEQARREGDTRKVAKYLQKIEEEKAELEALKREQADAMHPKEGGGMVAP